MKKFIALLLVLAISSVAGAGTMIISGLPGTVDTSAGPTVLSFDVVSNGQFDNDDMYVFATTEGTLDIATAINNVVAGEVYDDDPTNYDLLAGYVDVTDVSRPVIWADIAIVHVPPVEIIGDIISDLGLTIPQGYEGPITVSALSGTVTGAVEGMVTVNCIPEPVTIALLGLGGLFLRRRK